VKTDILSLQAKSINPVGNLAVAGFDQRAGFRTCRSRNRAHS